MSNPSFVKVLLVANNAGPSAFEPKQITLNVSSIIALNQRMPNSFEVVVSQQNFKDLEARYFGKNTTLKEITATSNDLKGLI